LCKQVLSYYKRISLPYQSDYSTILSYSSPFLEQLDVDNLLNLEFTPSLEETQILIAKNYKIRRNLLIKFQKDDIDETLVLNPKLQEKFLNMVALLCLSRNYLTPLR
jgi:hypothetical protein